MRLAGANWIAGGSLPVKQGGGLGVRITQQTANRSVH